MKNFIGISREIINHWIYKDAEFFKVWFEMLLRARYSIEPTTDLIEGQLVTINRGEFIFGRKSWSDRIGVSEQRLRTLLKKLKKDNMIKVTYRYNKFTIYKIINYEKYNQQVDQQQTKLNTDIGGNSNQQTNRQGTINQSASIQQISTKKESSNKDNKNTTSSSDKGKKGIVDIPKIKRNENINILLQEYKKCGFGQTNLMVEKIVKDLLTEYSLEWIQKAFRVCVESNRKNIKYAKGILRNWKKNGGIGSENTEKENIRTFKTRFHNFESRTSKYSAEELEKIVLKKSKSKTNIEN